MPRDVLCFYLMRSTAPPPLRPRAPEHCCSNEPGHVCFPGKPFDCFDKTEPDVRIPFAQKENDKLHDLWWQCLKIAIPYAAIPRNGLRDLPIPEEYLGIDCYSRDTICSTLFFTGNVVGFIIFQSVWLFLIFRPVTDHEVYGIVLFGAPVVLALILEVLTYLPAAMHKNVSDYASTFFPHVEGLTFFRWYNSRQIATHMQFRQIYALALSNLLILANLVSTDNQRKALQAAVSVIFFGSSLVFNYMTTYDRFCSEFYATKVMAQIHDYFASIGYRSQSLPQRGDTGASAVGVTATRSFKEHET
jgi:hypothetical protein